MLHTASVDRRPAIAARVLLLLTGVGAAAALRVAVGGTDPAASLPAALVFAAVLAALALAAGVRPQRPSPSTAAAGVGAGAVLFGAWVLSTGAALHPPAAAGSLAGWSVVVATVAVAQEAVFRGAVFTAVQRGAGPVAAVVVSSVAFALIHVPLYGWPALPVDALVGAGLGGLRLATGGIVAPAAAHATADLLAGWLA